MRSHKVENTTHGETMKIKENLTVRKYTSNRNFETIFLKLKDQIRFRSIFQVIFNLEVIQNKNLLERFGDEKF